MSYESPIPPLPSRKEELQMIGKIQKSFLDQKHNWNNIEMSDAQRLRRIDINKKKHEYRKIWWRNYIRGTLFSFPLACLVATRMNYRAYNVP